METLDLSEVSMLDTMGFAYGHDGYVKDDLASLRIELKEVGVEGWGIKVSRDTWNTPLQLKPTFKSAIDAAFYVHEHQSG